MTKSQTLPRGIRGTPLTLAGLTPQSRRLQ